MSWFRAPYRALLVFAVMVAATLGVAATELPGLAGANRAWVAMLIEDHAGMRELVWDPAFTNLDTAGPFQKNHRYAIQTKGGAGLVDLGCWDEAWPVGNGWRAEAPVMSVALSKDGSGATLTAGGKSTWLPVAAAYDGKGAPAATLRGAYLNWLLANRGTTPSIPRETRWQRLQRGAEAIVRDLLTRSGGQPEFRVVGIGTSGRLLIPPGEGLPAGLNAVSRMEPSDSGSMKEALARALETVALLRSNGACQPGIVLPIGDGWTLGGTCASGLAYESSPAYGAMIQTVRDIRATGQAEVWAWSVEGPRAWSRTFTTEGGGQLFSGDAVAALDAAIRTWMTRHGQPLQLTLTFDQPALTRVAQVTLTIQANHGLATLTLNGQAVQANGTTTAVPLTLKEGVNTFLVAATDLCGGQAQSSASITLDSVPPHILLNPLPPALTRQTGLVLTGTVDDPTAALTLNGKPVALDAQGGFSVPVALQEGQNAFAFVAVDPAGNSGRLDASVVRDTQAPVVVITAPLEGALTNALQLLVTGTVSDPAARLTVNGQTVPLVSAGGAAAFTLTLAPGEGALTLLAEATDAAGNTGRDERHVVIDRTAPIITLDPAPPTLVAAESLAFSGRVDDSKATLRINGQTVPLDLTGAFSAALPLTEGPNAFAFVATDAAGNVGTLQASVTRDTLAPVVHFKDPAEGLVTNVRTLVLTGQVDDLTAQVQVEGQPVTLDPTGFFSLPKDLVEGPMSFNATAKDAAGNVGTATRAIVVDWTAPAITLDAPVPVLTATPTYTFAGRVDDPTAALTVNGQPLTLDGEGRFIWVGTLAEGLNSFAFEATDPAGNVGRLGASLLCDTIAPLVTLTSPAEGFLTNAAQVLVQGRVDDPAAALWVNGQSVPVDATGAFTTTLSPAEGSFTVTATAMDLAGNTGQDVRHGVIDRTPPHITLVRPMPVMTSRPHLDIPVVVDDPSALVTFRGAVVVLDAQGAFTASVDLVEGPNSFLFTAQDRVGNASALQVTVVLDTQAPGLRVDTPVEGLRTNALQVPVQGSVDDPSAAVQVNGQSATVDGSGAFQAALAPPEGPLTILVTATDPMGNQSQETRHVLVDRTAPRITLVRTVPALVNVAHLAIEGRVDDPAASLTLNGSPIVLTAQGAFLTDVSLSEGENSFHFEAVDLTGNAGQLDAKTVRDTTPPVVTLDAPADGFVTNQHSLVVRGRVDDMTARLLVAGQSLSPAADGSFEVTVSPGEGPYLVVALATDSAGNSGHATRSVLLDWTPPVLAWTDPTPSEGAKVATLPVPVAAAVSEWAEVTLNGQSISLESGQPWVAKTTLTPAEGPVSLVLEARDRAGNASRLERHFSVGLSAPKVVLESPAEGFQTREATAVLVGHVDTLDVLKPLTLTLNGTSAPVGPDGRFSLPVNLVEGANPFRITATDAFGHQGSADRILNRFNTPFGILIDWPLNGLATPEMSTEVRGHVLRAGTAVSVNGLPATLDEGSLSFRVVVPLQPGLNTLTAHGTDAAGNQGEAQVQVTCAPPQDPAATYRWDVPANGTSTSKRLVHIQGQADTPGVASVRVNGQPMSLSGLGKDGHFEGDLRLETKGRNVLYLGVQTLAGKQLTERREVSFVPEMPRIRLQVPESARPGDTIPVAVSPETGTRLVAVDLSWNGRSLGRITDPFAPVQAQVPGEAPVGSRILVEALGTDAEGETVTARAYVTVYGQGALLVEAYDDSLGLPLKEGTAQVEGGESQALDAKGMAALRTALPQNWIKVLRAGYSPVWRSAGLQVGGVQATVDARLTPLSSTQPASSSPFQGQFGKGALDLRFPSGAFAGEGAVGATPLTTQGLPGLLPAGWSAVSAWWVDLGGMAPVTPGIAKVTLPAGAPASGLTWARWDESAHVWVALVASLEASATGNLPLPGGGGYALVVGDPGDTAPPAAMAGAQLPAFEGPSWREGFQATGSVDPATLPTIAAIQGARATAKFSLDFNGQGPIPSGTVIQVDVLESYALLDSALIEPDGFTQDAVASRWLLGVGADGAPSLKSVAGLGLELPVRMSRTFQANELVDGRIWVGFYHDGVQVAQSGSELLDASGGVVSHDGIQLQVPSGALQGTTLIRLYSDQGDLTALWPELTGKGSLLKSFQLDIVGTVTQGLGLRFEGLGSVPDGVAPLLVQRRVVQGERVLVALGQLEPAAGGWSLSIPEGGSPLVSGGAFAVLLPPQAWGWISGQATVPASIAQPLMARFGSKARLTPLKGALVPGRSARRAVAASGDVAVGDALVEAGYLRSVSAEDGRFAVPAFLTASGATANLRGERRDLGLKGALDVAVPSQGMVLRLASVPFTVMTVVPAELAEVSVGTVVEVMLSTAADPATLDRVKLYQEVVASTPSTGAKPAPAKSSKTAPKAGTKARKHALGSAEEPQLVEVPIRRALSQDGRTLLLTPETVLQTGATYRMVTTGIASVSGEEAPAYTRRFKTQAKPQFGDVDLTRVKLTYPTEAFDITVTIPEGAVPPWTIVEIEASDMGSYASGVMPPKGDLVFNLKANLGERLKITVQMMDGRSLQGTVSRYVAEDGRTTVGLDGGRVEGPGGLALVVQPGTLAAPAELTVEPMANVPATAEGAVLENERLMPGLRIVSAQPVEFTKPPILELPITALAEGVDVRPGPGDLGNGPLALYRMEKRTLPDGTEDEYSVLMDTAEVRDTPQGRKIVSLGGLRMQDSVAGTVVATQPFALPGKTNTRTRGMGARAAERQAKIQPLSYSPDYGGIFLWGAWAPSFDAPAPEYRYHSGTVYRNWNGLGRCGGSASASCYGELPGAEVHRYRGTLGLDEARQGRLARGRLLATCDDKGRYLNVGGPFAENVIPGQSWIALFAVDPRTGETSIDPGAVSPQSLGLPWVSGDHSLAITSVANPFDETLTAPRIRTKVVDAEGNVRSFFAVGDKGTLRLYLEPKSQPVVYGNVTGAITQSIGAIATPQANSGNGSTWIPIYTDIPVSFDSEGSWKVTVQGWSAKGILGGTSAEVMVTSAGKLGPALPGKPQVIAKEPQDGDRDADPSSIIKITFSEPILPNSQYFSLLVNGSSVRFKLLSQGQEASFTRPAQELWMVPDQRLSLGARVEVSVYGVQDLDTPEPNSLDPVSWSFVVRGAEEIGSLPDVGTFYDMVVHKGTLYAGEKIGESLGGTFDTAGVAIQGIRMIDVSDPSQPVKGLLFGGHGSWAPNKSASYVSMMDSEPFYKHEIRGMRVVQGVAIGGVPRDLLLVLTRPRQATEMFVWSSDGQNEYRSRHNTIWAFDITGDAASKGEYGAPKMLLASSLGTLSENWGKGLGSAGGMLGVVRLRGGLTVWDADQWRQSLIADAQAANISIDSLARRARRDLGYYPAPTTIVAANLMGTASGPGASVLSAVVCEGDDGKPWVFAAKSYSAGKLYFIDSKVGEPEAKATYIGGGPGGLDIRHTDLSDYINNEKANVVETLRGSWQNQYGTTEQGLLLLVATGDGTGGKLWVLSAAWREYVPGKGYMEVKPLATAILPGAIYHILPDPAKMLVGVSTNVGGYIFDLSKLSPTVDGPMTMSPLTSFALTGPMVLADGLLITAEEGAVKKIVVRNLDGSGLFLSDPASIDAQGNIQEGSGVTTAGMDVELQDEAGNIIRPRLPLKNCDWLQVVMNGANPIQANLLDPAKVGKDVRFLISPTAGLRATVYTLRVWGGDIAGSGFLGQSYQDIIDGKAKKFTIKADPAP